ncbi:MAG TPA: phosphatidate cytidylyltransferase [Steroidobacteraceae bacterium]|jgi:phosphatidate cytidylyltransferase|nr:phosphatidate cytidylyltransferase [Steroidobacteraceae bacterium]
MAEGIKKRVTTAVVLAAILLAVVLWLPPWGTQALMTLVVLAGAWEWSAFLRVQSLALRITYVVLIAALMAATWQLTADPAGRDFVLRLALVWWIVALGWVMFAPRRVSSWAAALAGVFALVPAWMALNRLVDFPRGPEWLLFALILVWAADIGAFFVGRRFGRTRLAPTVSPGKTWEGVVGGALASALVAALGSGRFDQPLLWFVPLCLAVVAFSIVGDLTESLLKRFAGMKDSGSLFPGHGGVMDRIDSVTGAAPILLLVLLKLGVHP